MRHQPQLEKIFTDSDDRLTQLFNLFSLEITPIDFHQNRCQFLLLTEFYANVVKLFVPLWWGNTDNCSVIFLSVATSHVSDHPGSSLQKRHNVLAEQYKFSTGLVNSQFKYQSSFKSVSITV